MPRTTGRLNVRRYPEGKEATCLLRSRRELEVQVLPGSIAINLNGHAHVSSSLKDKRPVWRNSSSEVENPT